ncbi:MAG TPA: DUF72 domain-containing protein [Bryobacteraceae bacterium]|nr:DUF72 domain-containing protein [Bryobacteraceae bacterium]
MSTLPLFEEPSSFDRERLRRKLEEAARAGVFVGASSWKYEGWCGQIYTRERYQTRGRFSEKRFAEECLAEYATIFPVVCGDFTFYQFPSEAYWRKLFTSAPPTLLYALKVPEDITVKMFPTHARYGPRAGQINESFLNAAIFDSGFLELLRPYRSQVAVLILEFGAFSQRTYSDVSEFLVELDPFLAALPRDFRYAVEIRNEEFLGPEYFAVLRSHGVAHVLNAWTRMPEIGEQMAMPEVFTADFTVARALLRKGRAYAEAVEKFSPYAAVKDPNPSTRQALHHLVLRATARNEPSYIFVNNRLEGNAPESIRAILEESG